MTQNQISYWKLQEDIRHNIATEAENQRSHLASEYIGYGTLAETERHNVVSEGITASNLTEVYRHNQAMEFETNRSNVAAEALKHESNVYNRDVGMYSASSSKEVGLANVAESARHNLQVESETYRHNTTTEDYNYYETDKDVEIKSKQNELKGLEIQLKKEEAYGGDGVNKTEERRHNEQEEYVSKWNMASNVFSNFVKGLTQIAPLIVIP